VALNEGNFVGVSQSVLDGTENLSSLAAMNSSILAGSQVASAAQWMPSLLGQVRQVKKLSFERPPHLAGAVTSETVACDLGGSISVSFNDANDNAELDSGDSVSMRFIDCTTTDGLINGGFDAQFNRISDGLVYAIDATMQLINFSVVLNSSVAQASGDRHLKFEERYDRTLVDVSGSALRSSATLAGVTTGVSISNYSSKLEDTYAVDTQTFSGDLNLLSFADKKVSVATTQAWKLPAGASYPNLGQMVITGDAGSKVRVTALSSSRVALELDANGDGIYEKTDTRFWSSLR
jgi:hypothetical protein